jgi:serine/threonine-protein kinase
MLPADVSVTRGPAIAWSVAVSPDGRTLVVAGTSKEGARLYARPLDRLEATPIAGTDRGSSPFFSPDGAWIGFFADGRLKRVPAGGGAAVDIVELRDFPTGASWGPDNRIVFAFGAESRLQSIHADGGAVEALNTKATPAYRPDLLADGRTILFESGGWVHARDLSTGRENRLVEGTAPRFAAGHVILSRGTTLFAAPIHVGRHELTGPAVPLVDGVAREPGTTGGILHYAVSPTYLRRKRMLWSSSIRTAPNASSATERG